MRQEWNCFFGKHDDVPIATSGNTQQDLYQCKCCGKQAIFHYGINCMTKFSHTDYLSEKMREIYKWKMY